MNLINETIKAEEAHDNKDALQSVVDNKRSLCFLTTIGWASSLTIPEAVEIIKNNHLLSLHVPKNPFDAYIIYRPYAFKQAQELAEIADKNGGFLRGTIEEEYRIGQLLEYDENDIWDYLKRNKKFGPKAVEEFKSRLQGQTTNLYEQLSRIKSMINLNEEKITKDDFKSFSQKRLDGATKITENAKEKGGAAMLTYYHFNVKLPYYKKASEGKLDLEQSKTEFKNSLDQLCKLTEDVDMDQIQFQKLVGKIEVLGELIIQNKKS